MFRIWICRRIFRQGAQVLSIWACRSGKHANNVELSIMSRRYEDAHRYHGLTDDSYQLSQITRGMMVPQRPMIIVSLVTQNEAWLRKQGDTLHWWPKTPQRSKTLHRPKTIRRPKTQNGAWIGKQGDTLYWWLKTP